MVGFDAFDRMDPVLGRQKLPVLLHRSLIDLLAVDLHAAGVVGLQDQAVDVGGAFTLLLVGQIRLPETARMACCGMFSANHLPNTHKNKKTMRPSPTRNLQDVLSFVVEDQVGSLGVAALVRAEHDVVGRRVAEGRWVTQFGTHLDVATTALDVLVQNQGEAQI